jgi:hypothetical protein
MAGSMGAYAQSPVFEWALHCGSKEYDQALGIATDREGNSFVIGFYNGDTAFFGNDYVVSYGGSDVFLAKYDPSGSVLWGRTLGGTAYEGAGSVATDDSGNVYVLGGFGSSDFKAQGSTQTFTSGSWNNTFVVKYDAAGNFRWAQQLGGSEGDYGSGVTVDRAGNVYVIGGYSSPDFSVGSATNVLPAPVNGDIFMVKLDPNGNLVWAKAIGGTENDDGKGIAVDSRNNLFVCGFFNGSADFDPAGGATVTALGVSDAFIAKYDSAGNFIWVRRMGGSSDDYGMSLTLDADDNVTTIGHITGGASFDSTNLILFTANASRDAFVASYDAAGNFRWARNLGGPGFDEGYGIDADGAGNIYVTGGFADTANFSANPKATLTANGFGEIFLAKYSRTGDFHWARSMGGSESESGRGVSVARNGAVYTSGYTLSDPADYNQGGINGQVYSIGSGDGYIVKLACGNPTFSTLDINACGERFALNGEVYTANGTYTQVIPNATGCDSTITLHLILHPVDSPEITVNGYVLGVSQSYVSYQWMDEGGDIQGATNATYTVTANGKYYVRVTDANGCEITSREYSVTNVAVDEVAGWARQIRVHPNPAKDMVYITSPEPVNLRLSSLDGRMLRQVDGAAMLDISSLAGGVYLLRITDTDGRLLRTERLLKQ